MIESLTSKYLENRKKFLPVLIEKCEDLKIQSEKNAFLLPFLIGTHFIETERDDSKAIHYLNMAQEWQPTVMVAYQLGYVYETRLRETLGEKKEKNEVKLGQLTESQKNDFVEMLSFYELATDHKDGKAMNQLGAFFVDFENLPHYTLPKTQEQYLLASRELKIPQATNNLIRLYRKTDQYDKLIVLLKERNEKMKTVDVLMDLILTMLNHGDYAGYCKFIKEYQGEQQIPHVMTGLLKSGSSMIQNAECCVCLEEKPCIKLVCTHIACNHCLFEIYAHKGGEQSKPACPICRRSLH